MPKGVFAPPLNRVNKELETHVIVSMEGNIQLLLLPVVDHVHNVHLYPDHGLGKKADFTSEVSSTQPFAPQIAKTTQTLHLSIVGESLRTF